MCKLVFDIGAYDGHKTAAFLAIADKVVCCEPDEKNFQLLKFRYRNLKKRVFLVNKGLGDVCGTADYFINADGSAFNTMSPKFKEMAEKKGEKKWTEQVEFAAKRTVEVITLDQLVQQYGLPEFIKIDTEGYEQKVISGLSQPVPYLSFECIYPEFKEELLQIVNHLELIAQGKVSYNFAYNEKLQLPSFVDSRSLFQTLDTSNLPYLEVIAHCVVDDK